jgi:hypothetical protein
MPARKARTAAATWIVGLALVLGVFAVPSTQAAEAPSAATHIYIQSYRNHLFTGLWVLPEDADAAVICYRAGGGPSSPAEASACSPPGRWGSTVETPGTWTDPAIPLDDFAVFSVVTAGPTYGPPARFTGEVPPPFPAEYLESTGVSNTAFDLSWRESTAFDANGGWPASGPGGTVEWLLYSTDGASAPEDSDTARLVAVVAQDADPTVVRVTGLRRDATYTFAVRGRDREGHLSPWSEALTTAARRPGLSLLDNGGPDGRWHAARVPGSRDARNGAALTVSARTSRADVAYTASAPGAMGEAQEGHHVIRRPNGTWRAVALPAAWRSLEHLVVGPDGTLAGTALVGPRPDTCLVRRAPRGHWAVRRCLPGGSWVDDVEVDARGRLHVLYTLNDLEHGSATAFYATDARARWVASALSTTPGLPGAPQLLAFDAASNAVVMVREATHSIRVAWKRPRDKSFGPARTWPKPSGMASFIPTSVASSHDRVTIAGLASRTSCCADARPYLLTGTRRSSRARALQIADVISGDPGPLVAAPSRRTVVVGWSQALAGWNTRRQGIWSSRLRQDRRGHWSLTRVQQRTRSAYDWLQGVSADASGRVYFLLRRDPAERVLAGLSA